MSVLSSPALNVGWTFDSSCSPRPVRHASAHRLPPSIVDSCPAERGEPTCVAIPDFGRSHALVSTTQVILAKIRLLSQSHVVHPGLQFFSETPPDTKIDPALVPGLKESGWTPELDAL